MYYNYYPVGHPRKIQKPPTYNPDWFGFIKCKVLAPRNLYIPLLLTEIKLKQNEKRVFPLCLKCAIDCTLKCVHTDSKREFIGPWSTVEVNKPVEVGYKLVEIFEVWDFEKSNDM